MKVLVIDNKDSFTYNLKHYLDQFSNNIDVVRCDRVELDAVDLYDKILFSPGPGLASEYTILYNILNKYESYKSILGVCLGHQVIADFYGASLHNLKKPLHGVTSVINHFDNCLLYRSIPNHFKIGHYHSWIVSNEGFPIDHLEITAKNKDGLIMSMKHREYQIRSVQFHPESILTEYGLQLIKNWIFS